MSAEAVNILYLTRWFLYLAIAGVGIEAFVSYIKDYPALEFAAFVLGPAGKITLLCDALGFVVFVCVLTLRSIDSALRMIGINTVKIGQSTGQFVWARRSLILPLIVLVGIGGCGAILLLHR